MGLLRIFQKRSRLREIGVDITWRESINQVFRIVNFDNNGTKVNSDGSVKAKSQFKPYGYLTVTNPNTPDMLLPIVHKDDYVLIEDIFRSPQYKGLLEISEILVVYRPKVITVSGEAGFDRCLHYVITPRGTIDAYFQKYGDKPSEEVIERLFVKFSWEMIRVEINRNVEI